MIPDAKRNIGREKVGLCLRPESGLPNSLLIEQNVSVLVSQLHVVPRREGTWIVRTSMLLLVASVVRIDGSDGVKRYFMRRVKKSKMGSPRLPGSVHRRGTMSSIFQ